jgi:hypothetical protein
MNTRRILYYPLLYLYRLPHNAGVLIFAIQKLCYRKQELSYKNELPYNRTYYHATVLFFRYGGICLALL